MCSIITCTCGHPEGLHHEGMMIGYDLDEHPNSYIEDVCWGHHGPYACNCRLFEEQKNDSPLIRFKEATLNGGSRTDGISG